jgi:hypothetical protein
VGGLESVGYGSWSAGEIKLQHKYQFNAGLKIGIIKICIIKSFI